MHNKFRLILCALTFYSCLIGFNAYADDVIVTDIVSDPSIAAQNEMDKAEDLAKGETESEEIALIETEMTYEIPLGISDGLQKDTPTGEVAKMSMVQCEDFIREMFDANSNEKFRERHEDVTATFSLYDEESASWKDYNCTYTDYVLYYSDDWSPGLEELRTLIYGENDCVSQYMYSMGCIRFLNTSGEPYRLSREAPVTLAEDTLNETLLAVHRTDSALYVITQMTESGVLTLGLPETKEAMDGESSSSKEVSTAPADTDAIPADAAADAPVFYSSLYVLDPDTLEVQVIQITAHYEDGSAVDVRNIRYSYDHGMSEFVKAGYTELLRHMLPSIAWGPEYIRTVKVTLDPGTESERTYLAQPLMGDALSITLPEGYMLYSDEALTQRWIDNGDYYSDLSLWAAQG